MKKIIKIVILMVILLLSGLLFLGFRHEVANFYNKISYTLWGDIHKVEKKLETLYSSGQFREILEIYRSNEAQYKSSDFINRLVLLSLVKLNNQERAASLFLSLADFGLSPAFPVNGLVKIPDFLYVRKNYGDLAHLYDLGIGKGDVNFSFYYGASLYEVDRVREAEKMLSYAFENGYIGADINYYMALIWEKKRNFDRAIFFMSRAHLYNRKDRDILINLIRLYRKKGDYKGAESILRLLR